MTIFIYIILSLIALGLLFWQISNLISVFYGSPYVKTRHCIIKKALEMVDLKKDDVFYELGCGSGDVLLTAAKYGVKAIGYEISPYYYILAKLRTMRYHNIEVKYQNIHKVDFKKADVIYCYLLPKLLSKIDFSKVKQQVKIISIGFHIPELKLLKEVKYLNHKIYLYSLSSL